MQLPFIKSNAVSLSFKAAASLPSSKILGLIAAHPLTMLSSLTICSPGVITENSSLPFSHSSSSHRSSLMSMASSAILPPAVADVGRMKLAQWRINTLSRSFRDVPSASPRSSVRCMATAAPNSKLVPSKDAQPLAEYINQGPLMPCIGISKEEVEAAIAQWQVLGSRLASQLKFDEDNLSPAELSRVYHYYLPTFMWVAAQLEKHRAAHGSLDRPPRALVVGITAPQGCGKTTLVEQLVELLCHTGRKAVAVSIDDFYLTYEKQQELAKQHPGNNLLQLRGNAGSHDMALGAHVISALAELRANEKLGVPRYNKSAYGGRGDRFPESEWQQVEGPLQVVLVEGWMLGFQPQAPEEIAKVDPMLLPVNEKLRDYETMWDSLIDSWLMVRIGDPTWVFKWRLQAEEAMRATGKAGMTNEQIADFVSRFMPAYKAYLPRLYHEGPRLCTSDKLLQICVDETRTPIKRLSRTIHDK